MAASDHLYSTTPPVDSAANEYIPGNLFLGDEVTGSSLILAVAQAGLRVPTSRTEEVLSVHLRCS